MSPWCWRPLGGLLLAVSLAACGASPPLRYHALAQPGLAPVARGGSASLLVEVLPIAVPERVNREEIVLTAVNGQLDVRDGDRWAAPLADELRQMVDDALWRQLRAADTYAAPVAVSADGMPQYRLALRLERLEAVPGRRVVSEATWTMRRLPQGKPVICRMAVEKPLPGTTPEAAVAVLASASARIGEAVATSMARLHGNQDDPCDGF